MMMKRRIRVRRRRVRRRSSSRKANNGHQPRGGVSSVLQTLANVAEEKAFRQELDNELDFKNIFTPEIL